jgi:hypothetical protein
LRWRMGRADHAGDVRSVGPYGAASGSRSRRPRTGRTWIASRPSSSTVASNALTNISTLSTASAPGFQTLARADRIHTRKLGSFQASSGLRTGSSMTLPCPGQNGRYGGTQSGRVSNTPRHFAMTLHPYPSEKADPPSLGPPAMRLGPPTRRMRASSCAASSTSARCSLVVVTTCEEGVSFTS